MCVAVAFHIARLVTFGYRQCPRFIYVESFARTKTLSRTGSLMQYLSDQVIVQWPGLERKVEKNHWWIVPCDYYGGPLI